MSTATLPAPSQNLRIRRDGKGRLLGYIAFDSMLGWVAIPTCPYVPINTFLHSLKNPPAAPAPVAAAKVPSQPMINYFDLPLKEGSIKYPYCSACDWEVFAETEVLTSIGMRHASRCTSCNTLHRA